jgi:hypothetical protein
MLTAKDIDGTLRNEHSAHAKNMRCLFKITAIAVVAATIPVSFVQAVQDSQQQPAAQMNGEIGTTNVLTTSGALPRPGVFSPQFGGHALDLRSDALGNPGLNQIDAAVPEPSTWLMIGVGAVLLAAVQRFRTRK